MLFFLDVYVVDMIYLTAEDITEDREREAVTLRLYNYPGNNGVAGCSAAMFFKVLRLQGR